MHHRRKVDTPNGKHIRGSVWVEQEIAIATFINHVLNRPLQVVVYMQEGIEREGIRQQLRLSPVEFTSNQEVLADVKQRIPEWTLTPVAFGPRLNVRTAVAVPRIGAT